MRSILGKLLGRGGDAQNVCGSAGGAPTERSVFCSGCYEVLPESRVKVLPFFNDDLDKFVTTYRCENCWMDAINDTGLRLALTEDENQIASVAEFFERHGIVLLEWKRGDSLADMRILLLDLLNKLRSGDLALSIGQTTPLTDAQIS